ncbi:hypothetical protein [Actinacidiphila sp. ITFR-21]|uniref:hypothetical protein n=1 Tax=Actinacidiphila sp. ITFR-21 TaxID=3075199 RepID=UPI00288AC02B|nr:hypothetical protein [Streptomyces sp. ITFR-21]WNI19156.1 hypothetical protein RLT57_28875 [Streptomyces sp. ITFR-21]
MPGFTAETHVKTETTRIFRVPAPADEGAEYEAVSAAAAAAWTEYREKTGLPEGSEMPPGILRFQPGDRQIVISWTVEEVA